jgi:CRISPR-associated protein Cmr2
MTQYMLLFSLGPVQSFIAQARKTRDLWLGSFLLSALMQASMEDIERTKLIFPFDPTIKDRIPDLPNKYIAVFDNLDEAKAAAKQSETHIINFWQMICKEVWNEVLAKPAISIEETHEQWKKQTDPTTLFEIFWVVVKEDSKKYPVWLKETQIAFDGRKHLRDFPQQEASGEKSTISGLRSALRGSGERRIDVQEFWQQVAKAKGRSPRDIDQDGSERLDAIDTVKRFAFLSKTFRKTFHIPDHDSGLGFPSTSSIAVAPFLERLILASKTDDSQLSNVINHWGQTCQGLNEDMPETIPFLSKIATSHKQSHDILTLDGDCLFPETFHPQRLKKEFGLDDTQAEKRDRLARSGPKALSNLLEETDKRSILRPTPYYAMIQMDGDKMGRLINGVQDEGEHKSISRALSDFSRNRVRPLVEENYPGRLIYAGGDDVFALAPLARDLHTLDSEEHQIKTVLNLVDQLQKDYCTVVRLNVIDHDVQLIGPNPKTRKELVTASTGIAIAHHYTALSYVRRVSKEAEQLAKNHYGRNALVITVLRRSGEQTRVGCHWQYPDFEEKAQPIPIPLFLAFYRLFKDDVLSPKCVFNLLEEAPTLVALDQEAQVSEIKRVLRRQRNPTLERSLPDDEIQQKATSLITLAEAMDRDEHPHIDKEQKLSVELHSDRRRYGLVEVLGWLLVMLFLARKEHE